MSKNHACPLISTLSILMIVSLLWPGVSHAYSGFSINPAVTTILSSSTRIGSNVVLQNLSNQNLLIQAQIIPFQQTEYGNAKLIPDSSTNTELRWLTQHTTIEVNGQATSTIQLAGQERKTITIRIQTDQIHPLDMDYNFCLILTTLQNTRLPQNTNEVKAVVNQQAAIGSIFFLSPFEPEKHKLRFSINLPAVSFISQIPYEIDVHNAAKTFAVLEVNIQATGILGNKEPIIILPKYYISGQSERKILSGSGTSISLPYSLIGPINVSYVLYDTISKQYVRYNQTLIYLPYKVMLGISALCVICILIFTRVKKRIHVYKNT